MLGHVSIHDGNIPWSAMQYDAKVWLNIVKPALRLL